jgi:hypothetical protein
MTNEIWEGGSNVFFLIYILSNNNCFHNHKKTLKLNMPLIQLDTIVSFLSTDGSSNMISVLMIAEMHSTTVVQHNIQSQTV